MTVFSFFWTDWAAPPFNFKKYHFGIKLWNCYSVQVSRNVTAKSEQQLFFFAYLNIKVMIILEVQVTQILIVKQILLMSTMKYV